MPVAGLGSRFTTVGITKPKPLIEVGGKPMVRWAADSIPCIKDDDFVFVVREAHVENHQLDDRLRDIFSIAVDILVIDYLTEGPACTAQLASECVDDEEAVVITDSDHYFESKAYCDLIQDPAGSVDGAIPVFESKKEGLSYSEVDENDVIKKVKEKERISPYANIGAYYFSKFEYFSEAIDKMRKKREKVNNEYYVAPVYNELISNDKKVVARKCSKVWSLGTPKSVNEFEKKFL